MKGFSDLTERQRHILKKHSIFNLLADWAYTKKQKAKLAEDIAAIKKLDKERKDKKVTLIRIEI